MSERGRGSRSWVARVAHVLLRFYPVEVRARHGDEMVEAYLTLVEASRRRGVFHGIVAAVGGLIDLALGIGRERRRAARRGGNLQRGTRGDGVMDRMVQDLRLAVRGLMRQPLFALVAAGSLAIGIGANTAVFSVANALLLQPPPGMSNYDRVVELGRTSDGRGFDTFAYPDVVDIREEVPALEAVAPYSIEMVSLSTGGEGVRGMGLLVGAQYFDVLGAVPSIGRLLVPAEDNGVGEHPVAVVSHAYWTTHLGADPRAVGSTILVNRIPLEVVGVAEEGFVGHIVGLAPDVFIPLMQAPGLSEQPSIFESRGSSWLLALGRRTEAATLEEIDTQLRGVANRLAEAYPDSNEGRGFEAMAAGPVPGAGRGGVTLFLSALLAMVGLVLLVTCTNVAGMFLARSASREREFAVRASLGAGRRTMVQQLTIEALLVFAVGGGAGIVLGTWLTALVRPELIPSPVPIHFSVQVEWTVLAVAVLMTLVTGLVFGLLPALRATRLDLTSSLRDSAGAGGVGAGRLRSVFAASQVGLSVVLLVTAGLFVRSLQSASGVDAGFDPDDAYVTSLDLSLEGYEREEGEAFQARLRESLLAESWVRSVALASDLPLDLARRATRVRPEGWETTADAELLRTDLNQVSPGYFEALGIALREGRPIDERDVAGATRVVVVSEQFAAEAWPGESALGRTVRLGRALDTDSIRFEVVGVAADVKNQMVNEATRPLVYLPLAQRYSAETQIVVRTDADEELVLPALRSALVEADPVMSRGPIVPLAAFTSVGLLPQRIAAWLTSVLAFVALLLSALGIYGVISLAVGSRRREIGIRLALGADAGSVVRRLVRRGVVLAVPGLVVGGMLALLVGQLIRALLLDLSPTDPTVLASVTVLLLSVVATAAWIPARRAAWVDPAESLRRE